MVGGQHELADLILLRSEQPRGVESQVRQVGLLDVHAVDGQLQLPHLVGRHVAAGIEDEFDFLRRDPVALAHLVGREIHLRLVSDARADVHLAVERNGDALHVRLVGVPRVLQFDVAPRRQINGRAFL